MRRFGVIDRSPGLSPVPGSNLYFPFFAIGAVVALGLQYVSTGLDAVKESRAYYHAEASIENQTLLSATIVALAVRRTFRQGHLHFWIAITSGAPCQLDRRS